MSRSCRNCGTGFSGRLGYLVFGGLSSLPPSMVGTGSAMSMVVVGVNEVNDVALCVKSVLLLQVTDEGRNKSSDNPANSAQGTETPSGAYIPTRRASISNDITSYRSRGFRTIHTPDQYHLINSN